MAYGNYGNYSGQYPQFQQPNQQFTNVQPQVIPPVNQPLNQPMNMQQQITPPITQPMNEFVLVQGVNEATMYPLAPGHTIMMMDSNDLVMYMKTRESNGRYLPMDIYDLVKRTNQQQTVQQMQQPANVQPQIDLSEYVRRDDLSSIIGPMIQEAVDKALAS